MFPTCRDRTGQAGPRKAASSAGSAADHRAHRVAAAVHAGEPVVAGLVPHDVLTELGCTSHAPLPALCTWAEEHIEQVLLNREAYDAGSR